MQIQSWNQSKPPRARPRHTLLQSTTELRPLLHVFNARVVTDNTSNKSYIIHATNVLWPRKAVRTRSVCDAIEEVKDVATGLASVMQLEHVIRSLHLLAPILRITTNPTLWHPNDTGSWKHRIQGNGTQRWQMLNHRDSMANSAILASPTPTHVTGIANRATMASGDTAMSA